MNPTTTTATRPLTIVERMDAIRAARKTSGSTSHLASPERAEAAADRMARFHNDNITR